MSTHKYTAKSRKCWCLELCLYGIRKLASLICDPEWTSLTVRWRAELWWWGELTLTWAPTSSPSPWWGRATDTSSWRTTRAPDSPRPPSSSGSTGSNYNNSLYIIILYSFIQNRNILIKLGVILSESVAVSMNYAKLVSLQKNKNWTFFVRNRTLSQQVKC